MPTATEQITKSIADLREEMRASQKKNDTAIEGLLKMARQPARELGVTPAQLLTQLTKDLGDDGAALLSPHGVQVYKHLHAKRLGEHFGQAPVGFNDFLTNLRDYEITKSAEKRDILDKMGTKAIWKNGDLVVKTAALAESSGITGGYTVPPQFANQLLMLALEKSILQRFASKQTLTSRTLELPSLDQTTVQNASGGQTNILGGIYATWTAESQLRPQTSVGFRKTTLTAWELSAYLVASNNLLADNAVGLDSILSMLFSNGIAWYTDWAFFQGNGVGKPLGIINSPAFIQLTRTTTNHVKFADIANMWAHRYVMDSGGNSLIWCAHPAVQSELITMQDGASRPVFISAMGYGVQEAVKETDGVQGFGYLMGRPCILTEKLPNLGTAGDICLIDASKYLIGQRQELEIAVSPHVNFLNNQMVWRLLWRGDGRSWLNTFVTLADGSYQVSPFVGLAH